jgi:hypothetical protein
MERGRFRKDWWREGERGVRYREKGKQLLILLT